jgi:hypothetical protein
MELVPQPLWGVNLRLWLGQGRWRKFRQALIDEGGQQCAICKSPDRPHGHEIWEYRDKKRVGTARLKAVEIICQNCHDIHHWGRTKKLIDRGEVSLKRHNELKRHFRMVNHCTQREFEAHADSAFLIWGERSFKEWKVDWGDFRNEIAEAEIGRQLWMARRLAKRRRQLRAAAAP